MINTSKKALLIYKAIIKNDIAFANEMVELGHLQFLKIKNDCFRFERARDKHKHVKVKATTFKNPNDYQSNIILSLDYFEGFLKTGVFKDYNSLMKQVARSIIQYNDDSFIYYLISNSISYTDVENFLNLINLIKGNINSSLDDIDNASNLALLDENTDLIDVFFNFIDKCKIYFGYGNFKTVINKLEQLYMFENEKLRSALERPNNYQRKMYY